MPSPGRSGCSGTTRWARALGGSPWPLYGRAARAGAPGTPRRARRGALLVLRPVPGRGGRHVAGGECQRPVGTARTRGHLGVLRAAGALDRASRDRARRRHGAARRRDDGPLVHAGVHGRRRLPGDAGRDASRGLRRVLRRARDWDFRDELGSVSARTLGSSGRRPGDASRSRAADRGRISARDSR